MTRLIPLLLLTACVRAVPPPVKHDFNYETEPEESTFTVPSVEAGPTRAVNNRDFLLAALDAVDAAEDRIRVAQYVIYDDVPVDALLDHLVEAVERGVRVQVLADEEGGQTQSALDAMAAGGVETQVDSLNVTTHNKLIIADDAVVLGSHNFTDAAMDRNNEGSILVNDAEVSAWYGAWYDSMWEDPRPDPQVPDWSRTDFVPLADRMVTDALISCMNSASEDIELVMYAIAWDDNYPGSDVDRVLTTLEAAHDRGVEIRVVVDGSFWVFDNGINDAAIARLDDAGIPIWRTDASVVTHAKVLRCDDTVVISDANWSYSGLEQMHGTSLVATTNELSGAYRAWMGFIFDDADEL